MPLCSACPNFTILVLGDFAYDASLAGQKGKCSFCPPQPTGEYRLDLSDWSYVLGTDDCNQCQCEECSGGGPQ